MQPVLLNLYNRVDAIGGTVTYLLVALMAIVWIWVMFKYLDTSDLND